MQHRPSPAGIDGDGLHVFRADLIGTVSILSIQNKASRTGFGQVKSGNLQQILRHSAVFASGSERGELYKATSRCNMASNGGGSGRIFALLQ